MVVYPNIVALFNNSSIGTGNDIRDYIDFVTVVVPIKGYCDGWLSSGNNLRKSSLKLGSLLVEKIEKSYEWTKIQVVLVEEGFLEVDIFLYEKDRFDDASNIDLINDVSEILECLAACEVWAVADN